MQKHFIVRTIAGASLSVLCGAAFAQVEAYTNAPTYVYAGPAADYPAVAQLPEGVSLSVMGCVDGYTWCDVAAPDLRGWVYGGTLSSPYQGANVPLVTYGYQIGLPVVAFSVDSYWDQYYRGRPWYHDEARWASHPPPPHGGPPPVGHEAGHPPAPQPGRQAEYGRAPQAFPERGGAPQRGFGDSNNSNMQQPSRGAPQPQAQPQGRPQPQAGFQSGPGQAHANGAPQPQSRGGGEPPAQRGTESHGGSEHDNRQNGQ